MGKEAAVQERPIWENLSRALEDEVDLTRYPTVVLPGGDEGWYIGCHGNSPGFGDPRPEERLYERYGERLHTADGCTVEIANKGNVLDYGSSPFAISYAVRKTPEEIEQASKQPRLNYVLRRIFYRYGL